MSVSLRLVFVFCTVACTLTTPLAQAQNRRGQDQGGPSHSAEHFLNVIVVLDENFAPGRGAANRAEAADVAAGLGIAPSHVYGVALHGFAARIPEVRLSAIERDPRVAYVNMDATVSIPRPPPRGQAPKKCLVDPNRPGCPTSEEDEPALGPQVVPWGVDRINAYPNPAGGAGIDIYILDTGIDHDHTDLFVTGSVNCTGAKGGRGWKSSEVSCGSGGNDDNGHGTHVAGTAAASDNEQGVVGVAPSANLWAVKVLDNHGSGKWSWIIAGIDWVAEQQQGSDPVPVVANMSLSGSGSKTGTCTSGGFSGSDSLHQAICNATHQGVIFAVAAGNDGADAQGKVPAAYDDAVITVSATNSSDDWVWWSNYGNNTAGWTGGNNSAPVAIAAPGVSILSTWNNGGTNTISGTSMATPHVAGALALYLDDQALNADFSAFETARDALLLNAEVTNGFLNTSGHPHAEDFIDAGGL